MTRYPWIVKWHKRLLWHVCLLFAVLSLTMKSSPHSRHMPLWRWLHSTALLSVCHTSLQTVPLSHESRRGVCGGVGTVLLGVTEPPFILVVLHHRLALPPSVGGNNCFESIKVFTNISVHDNHAHRIYISVTKWNVCVGTWNTRHGSGRHGNYLSTETKPWWRMKPEPSRSHNDDQPERKTFYVFICLIPAPKNPSSHDSLRAVPSLLSGDGGCSLSRTASSAVEAHLMCGVFMLALGAVFTSLSCNHIPVWLILFFQ